MKSGVYCLIINNKRYIGSSINFTYRIKYHLSRLKNNKHFNRHLQSAYNLYGIDCLSTEIMTICSKVELLSKEKYYIDFYKTLDNNYGYNAAPNPFQGARGVKWTSESKIKLTNTLLSQYANGERKRTSFSHTDEVKQSISKKLMGHKAARTKSVLCHQNNITYDSLHLAAKSLNISISGVCDVLKQRKSSCKGYTFEYKVK